MILTSVSSMWHHMYITGRYPTATAEYLKMPGEYWLLTTEHSKPVVAMLVFLASAGLYHFKTVLIKLNQNVLSKEPKYCTLNL